jgi:cyclopropane fatty-acyl-phospholipid synthase-like methyltransferase
MLRRKAALVNSLVGSDKTHLLDYGAGTGYFARAMQRLDWDVTAIEKSEQARKYSQEQFGFEILPVEALDDCEAGCFDVVTMWHVMEHIQDINGFWGKLHHILDDSGIAVIALPNSASYDAQAYREHWAAYDVPRHLWHFSPSTVMKFGRKHGFILERQYTMPFDGFYISMLSERYKGSKLSLVKGVWSGLLGWLASWSKKSASSSIIYVFRKAV